MSVRPELVGRAEEYGRRRRLVIGARLGSGVHGIVLAVASQAESGRAAIKVHDREVCYQRERDVYLRLKQHDVAEIAGCAVPQLQSFDDDLWVIEMSVVTRPFVLDFAGAYLDHWPEFSDEVLADWRAEKQEQFGSRWSEVQAILGVLEGYGIYMEDVSPNNIALVG